MYNRITDGCQLRDVDGVEFISTTDAPQRARLLSLGVPGIQSARHPGIGGAPASVICSVLCLRTAAGSAPSWLLSAGSAAGCGGGGGSQDIFEGGGNPRYHRKK